MPSSKSPSVEGFVSISPAVRSSTFARRSSRSRLPRSVVATFASSNPAIVTLAGFVPCAVSAVMITLRPCSPRSAKAARISIRPGELALRAGRGLERDRGQPGDLGEDLLQLPHQLERALRALVLLQRMQVAEAGQADGPLVDARVVLHRAAAERVEARVDPEVAVGERREVAHDLVLGHLREPRRPLAPKLGGQLGHRQVVRRARDPRGDPAATSRRSAPSARTPRRAPRRAGRRPRACASR